MKKILVLMFALLMNVNCKAQWQVLLRYAKNVAPFIESGNSVVDMVKSPHTMDLSTGKELCEIDDYERALDYLSKVNEKDHDAVRVEAYYFRALCYFGLEEYKTAVKLFNKVIDFETSWNTLNENLIDELKKKASTLLVPALAMSLNSDNSYNFTKGYQLYIRKDFEGALKSFFWVNERDQALLRVMTHYYKGMCRVNEKEIEKAILNFKRVVNFTVPDNDLYGEQITSLQISASFVLGFVEAISDDADNDFLTRFYSIFEPEFVEF